jgi:hypothetical protein
MSDISVEHVLLFVVVAYLVYYSMGGCGINGFRVGADTLGKEVDLNYFDQCTIKSMCDLDCAEPANTDEAISLCSDCLYDYDRGQTWRCNQLKPLNDTIDLMLSDHNEMCTQFNNICDQYIKYRYPGDTTLSSSFCDLKELKDICDKDYTDDTFIISNPYTY